MPEEFLKYVIIYAVVDALTFGFACRAIEKSKGYDDSGAWFLWGTLFNVMALIVVCAKPVNKEGKPKSYTGVPRIFYCPNCNATYGGSKIEELVCPRCKQPLIATTFLREKWQQFSEERKEELRLKMREGHGLLGEVEMIPEKAVDAASAFSPADEIKKYKELLDMGAITQEEFEAKKKQLLNL